MSQDNKAEHEQVLHGSFIIISPSQALHTLVLPKEQCIWARCAYISPLLIYTHMHTHWLSLAIFLSFSTGDVLIFSASVYCAVRPLFWERCQVSLGLSLPPNEAVHFRECGIKLRSPGSGVSSNWIIEMMELQKWVIIPTRHVISGKVQLFFFFGNRDIHGFKSKCIRCGATVELFMVHECILVLCCYGNISYIFWHPNPFYPVSTAW